MCRASYHAECHDQRGASTPSKRSGCEFEEANVRLTSGAAAAPCRTKGPILGALHYYEQCHKQHKRHFVFFF